MLVERIRPPFALLVLVLGCVLSFSTGARAGIDFDARHALTEGMTLAEVQAALGERGKEVFKGGAFWLTWEGQADGFGTTLSLRFTDDERLEEWVFEERGPAARTPPAAEHEAKQAPVSGDEALQGSGGWVVRESRDPMDDTVSVSLHLLSSNQLPTQGTLIVRCQDAPMARRRKAEVHVHTDVILDNESADSFKGYRPNKTYVRLRYDQDEPVKSEENTSKSEDTVFLDAAKAIPRLLDADKLSFEFTPLRTGPQVYEFDLRGLSTEIERLRTAGCSW